MQTDFMIRCGFLVSKTFIWDEMMKKNLHEKDTSKNDSYNNNKD